MIHPEDEEPINYGDLGYDEVCEYVDDYYWGDDEVIDDCEER